MGRRKGQRNAYAPKHHSACRWCGAAFGHIKPGKECCSKACRERLREYRRRLGFDPLTPPGPRGAAAVIRDEIAALIARERERRAASARGAPSTPPPA